MEVCILWELTPPEWITCNSKGSFILDIGQASARGFICDSQGYFLATFSTNLDICYYQG
ncbi:hypothetical protein LINPERHAP2_LOCUS15826 [Linum perenne]